MNTVYGNIEEDISPDDPQPLGKLVHTMTFKDANLMHDFVMGIWAYSIFNLNLQTDIQIVQKYSRMLDARKCYAELLEELPTILKAISMPA
jgi:hypothetical protein